MDAPGVGAGSPRGAPRLPAPDDAGPRRRKAPRPDELVGKAACLPASGAQHERLYGIFWATDESDPEGIIEGYLDRHAFKTLDAWHGNVRLVVYTSAQQAPGTQPILAGMNHQAMIELIAIMVQANCLARNGTAWRTRGRGGLRQGEVGSQQRSGGGQDDPVHHCAFSLIDMVAAMAKGTPMKPGRKEKNG